MSGPSGGSGSGSGQANPATSGAPPTLHPTASQGQAGSPVKEPSILQRGMSVDEQDGAGDGAAPVERAVEEEKGVPIRQ